MYFMHAFHMGDQSKFCTTDSQKKYAQFGWLDKNSFEKQFFCKVFEVLSTLIGTQKIVASISFKEFVIFFS